MTTPRLRSRESGSALIVVLVALMVLTPLALLLSTLSTSYQRRTTAFRDGLRSRYAVRGALDVALAGLRTADPPLTVGNEQRFELAETPALPVTVRVTRDPDSVVGIDGRVLRGRDVAALELGAIGIDGERRQFRRYRPLEVYVVQAETPGSVGNPGIRLVASVARMEDGELLILGTRFDTALFQATSPVRK